MNLTFEHIGLACQKKSILDDVTFTADSGSITALTGCNGAGKTSLLRCLMGQARYRGNIYLDRQERRSFSLADFSRTAAYLPQELPQPHVTVQELAGFGRTPYGSLIHRQTAQDTDRVQWALAAVGLEKQANAFVDTLSGGERRKAFFAMTLAQDTPVILLDEPTAHLDAASRFDFLQLIASMSRETGKTILMVSHDLADVLQYANRIVVLRDRKVAFDGTPEQCLAQQIPQTCFSIQINGDRQEGFAVAPLK